MRTLQQKFAVLLGVFTLIVALTLGVSMWFGRHLERELRWPLQETSLVLRDLARLKRTTGELTRLLPGPERDEPGLEYRGHAATREGADLDPSSLDEIEARFREIQKSVHTYRDALFSHAFLEDRAGVSTARNLRARVRRAAELADAWFETGRIEAGISAGDEHYQIHELIEQMERKIIEDATDYATGYNDELGRAYRIVVVSGIIVAALVGMLGVLLVKRWIIAPIEDLRVATERIASGDFSHRLSPVSTDELGQLASEVDHMAGMIDTMQREAIERERLAAMGEMLRRLTHNIRNPLAGIRSIAELSSRRAKDDESLRADQQSIISTVDRFNSWLSELLDATSPLSVACEDHRVGPWLRKTVESQRPIAQMKGIGIVIDDESAPERASFDSRHLEHAVVGVLTNALQASPNGSQVIIRVTGNGDRRWAIEISDEGPGIPDEIREKIFTPYFTTKSDGNGIGLAVTHHIVTQHQGNIRIVSSPESGTRFVLDLPLMQD